MVFSNPEMDARKKKMYFGLQEGGIGQINLENRKLEFSDSLGGRRILSGITLCSYETGDFLYFGTKNDFVKFDLGAKEVSWTKKLKSTAGLVAPLVDDRQNVLFR